MPEEIEVLDYYDRMNQVMEHILQGYTPMQTAKLLGMQRKEVIQYADDWKNLARNNNIIQERAKDAITGADQHYSMIIRKLWESVDQAEQLADIRLKKDVLNSVANVEEKRINMLQKAGLLDNQELAEQLMERERREKIVTDLLRDIASDHPEVRAKILAALSKVTGQAEGVEG